jgi:O-antigen/teichoic acid export membrane protein
MGMPLALPQPACPAMMTKKPHFLSRLEPQDILTDFAPKAVQFVASISGELIELVVSMLIMILVERGYGQRGLGIYSFLTACMFLTRFFANFGVNRFVESEIATATDHPKAQQAIMDRGYQAVMLMGLAASALFLLTAACDSGLTRIEERSLAYVLIALILPIANLNSLKLSILRGLGQHTQVARLKLTRYALLFGSMWAMILAGIPPSFLLIPFLISDAVLMQIIRRHLQFSNVWRALRKPDNASETLRKGYAYLLADGSLDILLNIDLFVLGLFVHAKDLGVYAEAAILARFFMIVPVGVKPVFRRHDHILAAQGQLRQLATAVHKRTRRLFSLHAVLAVVMLLYFPSVLDFFFKTPGEGGLAFRIFSVFIPGLLVYCVFYPQETLYEATGKTVNLKRLTIFIASINIILTFFLVPAAGFFGAALATSIAMFFHFLMFQSKIIESYRFNKRLIVLCASAIYLCYIIFQQILGFAWLSPLLLLMLFYFMGLYGVQHPQTPSSMGESPSV